MIHVDLTGAAPFFGAHTPDYAAAEAAHRTLSEKTGAGSDFLGWTELPRRRLRSKRYHQLTRANMLSSGLNSR